MATLPNCIYCGRFCNPDNPGVEIKPNSIDPADGISYFHSDCQPPNERKPRLYPILKSILSEYKITDRYSQETIHHKALKKTIKKDQDKFFLLLSDQTAIIGSQFEVMKIWKRQFSDRKITDMFPTDKRVNNGVTSLTKFIESEPEGFK